MTATAWGPSGAPPEGHDVPVDLERPRTPADRVFRGILIACSSVVLLFITGILGFLLVRAGPAWRHQGLRLITSDVWARTGGSFGFLGALVGSVLIAIIALTIAMPISLATALAINEYLPRGIRRGLTTLVDLLAALPSLVFGMWGLLFLDAHLHLTSKWLGRHADFFPPLRLTSNPGQSLFVCGVVVAIMIIPIVTSISREVMSQTPREDCEAALALGGTRWGMVTDVILPFSRNGILGGAMLGLGRALGETIAVSLILLSDERLHQQILQSGGGSVSALIVREFAGSSTLEQSALMLAGLTLFAMTLGVNLLSRLIVARSGRAVK